MNDEEIMKKFNEAFSDDNLNNSKKKEEPVTPYRVTSNLNANISNVSNTNNLNLENNNEEKLDINDLLSQDPNTYYSSNSSSQSNYAQYDSNVNYNYIPTYNSTQNKKKNTIKVSSDMKILFIIVAILFVFILIIPTIYNVVREILIKLS